MARKEQANAAAVAQQQQDEEINNGIENYELQRSILTRVAKEDLPPSVKIQKDAMSGISKSATVFINYLASTAHEISTARGVKTISAADVLNALDSTGFYPEELSEELERELEAYRAVPKKPRPSKSTTVAKKAVSGAPSGSPLPPGSPVENNSAEVDELEDDDDEEDEKMDQEVEDEEEDEPEEEEDAEEEEDEIKEGDEEGEGDVTHGEEDQPMEDV